MSKLTILHLSDLHHRGKDATDQQVVISAFKDDLDQIKQNYSIDLIVFSGDLVQSGQTPESFKTAYSDILEYTCESLSVDKNKVFICPGNHDIDREEVRKKNYIEKGLLSTLTDRDEINKFIDGHISVDISRNTLPEVFDRMKNFYNEIWAPLCAEDCKVSPFSVIHKLRVNDVDIAVCIFNSAWRCTGEPNNADKGNLIIGERVVDDAVQQTSDVAIRIAVFHHPFDWLTEADRTAVEARFHSDFHAFFYGHVHSTAPTYTKSHMGGAVYSQAGCLYENRQYFNGYNIVEVNLEESEVTISAREYTDRLRKFTSAIGAIPDGRVSFEFPFDLGATGNNIMALLATVRPNIKRLGDEHVRLASEDHSKLDLEKHFICPPLSRSTRNMANDEGDHSEAAINDELSILDILSEDRNFILLGPSESGKTSIIHYAALKVATEASKNPRLPLRAKFYDFKIGRKTVWRAVRAYANEISDGKLTSKNIEQIPILLFVDEIVPGDNDQFSLILDLMEDFPNIRWFFVADGTEKITTLSPENEARLEDFETVSIQELTRSSIRRLSAQWLDVDVEHETTNDVFNKVMEHITRSGLPRSGYIVSLILWTLRRGLSGDIINEAVLLENLIEYMLNKMDYRGALRSEFDYHSRVAVLQELSMFFRASDVSLTKNELVSEVIGYLDRKGLKYDGSEIVNSFVNCGLLSEMDDTIEFRYRRFEEYFTAGYLRDNRNYFEHVVNDAAWNGYSRVMDMYTSRYRNEVELLSLGREKVDAITIPTPSLTYEEILQYMAEGANLSMAAKRLKKMQKEPMSARKIDELRDKADASVTRRRSSLKEVKNNPHETEFKTLMEFMAALEVYTNFIRNIEFADSENKILHLDHCLNLWEKHSSILISGLRDLFVEVREDMLTDPDLPEELRDDIVQISQDVESQFKFAIPRMISTSIYHKLGTDKLAHLIKDISEDEEGSKLKRIVTSFVLMDIDPAKGMDVMSSGKWHETMSDDWINSLLENKLHQYYREQHLPGQLREKFEQFAATLETRLIGDPKALSDRKKSARIQWLGKQSLLDKTKERAKNI